MKDHRSSSTALFVANGLWRLSTQRSLRDEVPDVLRNDVSRVATLNRGLFSPRSRWGKWLLGVRTALLQTLSVPGIYLHFAVRKRRIETSVRRAIDEGAAQLVVIGAGFDTLSLRMLEAYPSLSVIEVDHPATQEGKRRLLLDHGPLPGRFHFLPLDLTKNSLKETLWGSDAYRADLPAVFVAEGLLMYLKEAEVESLLRFAAASGPASRLVFTYMEEGRPGDFHFANATPLVRLWLRFKKEVFSWGLRPEKLEDFLSRCGLRLVSQATHADLRADLLTPAGVRSRLARGENVVVAGALAASQIKGV